MGAWGSGSFENDTAMDWAAEVQSVDDVRKPFERLKRDTDAHGAEPALVLDADFASELIAAAETVAMLMGRRSRDFPDDLAQRLADSGEPDDLLFHQARNGALHAMRHSELAELWAEAAEEGGPNPWLEEMTGLFDRLNPDIEATPWKAEEVEQRVGGPAGPCAFCGEPVSRDEMFLMTIFDATDNVSFDRGFWFHLPCLNARMHHKHAIANLKFDPNNMPDLDKLQRRLVVLEQKSQALAMYILTITYPKSADANFDFDYFRSKHLPAVGKAFKPFGLGYASVLRGEELLGGGDPAYFATTILSFATEEGARNAVVSDAGKALADDIANFTSVTPVMQFNSAVP